MTLKHTNRNSHSNSESGEEENKVARGLDSESDRESVGALRAELMAANTRISELELELLRQSEDSSAAAAAVAEKMCALEKGLGVKDDKLQTALRAAALRETDLRFGV